MSRGGMPVSPSSAGGAYAGLLGVVSRDDVRRQTVAAHRGPVAAASSGRHAATHPCRGRDKPVAKRVDEVVDNWWTTRPGLGVSQPNLWMI